MLRIKMVICMFIQYLYLTVALLLILILLFYLLVAK